MSFDGDNYNVKLYDTLGVPKSANEKQIKSAYKKLAMTYHPDRNKAAGEEERNASEEKFKEISVAYSILGDKDKRSRYDQFGMDGVKNDIPNINPFDFANFTTPGFNIDAMFSKMFNHKSKARRLKKGPNKIDCMRIPLEDYYQHKKIFYNLKRHIICTTCKGYGVKDPSLIKICKICEGKGSISSYQQLGPGIMRQSTCSCYECGGEGNYIEKKDFCVTCYNTKVTIEEKKISIQLGPNSRSGEKIVLKRKANEHPDYDVCGDFILELGEEPNDTFTRHKDDLYTIYNISLMDALCGGEVIIKHMDKRNLYIKTSEIIQSKSTYRILNEGMKRSDGKCGDLIVSFHVVLPKKMSDERKKYIKKLLPKPIQREFIDTSKCEVKLMERANLSEPCNEDDEENEEDKMYSNEDEPFEINPAQCIQQ